MDALYKLKQKLKSQTGASITFALLLFLVCAVVGSAVLVAGTAAAGRMSKIAEMDQRYYAVNSAARLLIETIENETITVSTTSFTETTSQTEENETTSSPHLTIIVNGDTVTDESQDSFPLRAADFLGFLGKEKPSESQTETFTIKVADSSIGEEAQKSSQADITETINPNGSLKFEISKALDSSSGYESQGYALRLTFGLDKYESKTLDIQNKTETVKITLKWRLVDTETVVNRAMASPTVSSSPDVSGG